VSEQETVHIYAARRDRHGCILLQLFEGGGWWSTIPDDPATARQPDFATVDEMDVRIGPTRPVRITTTDPARDAEVDQLASLLDEIGAMVSMTGEWPPEAFGELPGAVRRVLDARDAVVEAARDWRRVEIGDKPGYRLTGWEMWLRDAVDRLTETGPPTAPSATESAEQATPAPQDTTDQHRRFGGEIARMDGQPPDLGEMVATIVCGVMRAVRDGGVPDAD
jgi:hypothetical protein